MRRAWPDSRSSSAVLALCNNIILLVNYDVLYTPIAGYAAAGGAMLF